MSEAGQSYGGQSISSASLCSFSKDSLRWEKKKIERNRFKRGLEITPRRSSPEYELFSALTEAIDEKMKKNDFPAEDNCQSLPQARPSFGRGQLIFWVVINILSVNIGHEFFLIHWVHFVALTSKRVVNLKVNSNLLENDNS